MATSSPIRQIMMYDPHGPEHAHGMYVAELLRAFQECQHEIAVSFLASEEWSTIPDDNPLRCRLFPVLPVPLAKAKYPTVISWLFARLVRPLALEVQIVRHLLSHPEIAVVHYQLQQSICTILSRCIFRRLRKPRLLTVHNIEPHNLGPKCFRAIRTVINRAVLRSFDALIVHSDKLRSDLSVYLAARG